MPPNWVHSRFSPNWADEILHWATSADELRAWANLGGRLEGRSIFLEWHADPNVHAFILSRDDESVAYGEIWVDSDAGEVELGRILVKPTFRRHGIGRKLMACLLEEAGRAGFRDAFLRVHPGNTNAIACYEGAGFSRVSFEQEQLWNRGQPAEYLWFQRNV